MQLVRSGWERGNFASAAACNLPAFRAAIIFFRERRGGRGAGEAAIARAVLGKLEILILARSKSTYQSHRCKVQLPVAEGG